MKKIITINLIAFILFCILLSVGLLVFLNVYTNHNETYPAPNVLEMQVNEAIKTIDDEGFNHVIVDTVADKRYDNNVIVYQNPEPNSQIKKGRKIRLTVNTAEDIFVVLPNIIDSDIRIALNTMINSGLRIKHIEYLSDSAGSLNRVLYVKLKGNIIKPGKKIKKYSEVELFVSKDNSKVEAFVPNVIGLTYDDANDKLVENYLNIGKIHYDKSVKSKKDSINARVYKQNPIADTIKSLNLGSYINIWLSIDDKKLKNIDK